MSDSAQTSIGPVAPAQEFIGPAAAPVAVMEEVEYDAPVTPIQPVVEVLPRGAGSDPVHTLKTSLTLAQDEIASLSALVVTFTGSQGQLRSYRSQLSKRVEDLELLGKALKLVQSTAGDSLAGSKLSKVVPRDLPLFQWIGNVTVPGAHVFVDINTCLMKFTDIMMSHDLDLNSNYLRVLPPLLAGPIRLWFEDFRVEFAKLYQRDPLWLEFTSAFRFRYGINAEEERNNCAMELDKAEMKTNETLEKCFKCNKFYGNYRKKQISKM
ncbi:hypothetical protein MFLAVUS_011301 [Mucor flavus]|uniref:Retrotransposon gag domain-containing protein n=1 Tax=Mucor flavus TaxID=439312 RepID=A0ABP9ZFB8_9FUNG